MATKVQVESGALYKVVNGQRVGFTSLADALQYLAQCCGVDCCDGVIRIPDTVTGEIVEISVVDGVLTIDNDPTDEVAGVPVVPAGAAALGFGDFYALMPGDNAATVALGGSVDFPQDGPNSGDGIVRSGVDTFILPDIGTYKVDFQVSVDEPGQLVIALGGVEQPETVVGRATGTSQIVGSRLITTTVINTVLSINNPAGNAAALTITPIAGGASAVSASLVIVRVA